jgi:hypothetical protein
MLWQDGSWTDVTSSANWYSKDYVESLDSGLLLIGELFDYQDPTIIASYDYNGETFRDSGRAVAYFSQAQLSNQRELWDTQGLTNYQYDITRSAYNVSPFNDLLRVTVSGGEIVEIFNLDQNEFVDMADYDAFGPIEITFNTINNALVDEADQISVEYDSIYGFPVSVFIDYSVQIVDEEYSVTVTNFNVLP